MFSAKKTDLRILTEMAISGIESRPCLCNRLGLSKAAVTQSVNRLMKHGYVAEGTRFNRSQLGRKTTLLSIKPDLANFIGTDLEGSAISACIIDCRRNIVASGKRAVHPSWSKQKTIQQWFKLIDETIESSGLANDKIAGIGVGLPGVVAKDGFSTHTFTPSGKWIDINIAAAFSKLGYPITAANNVICVSEYERKMGMAKGVGNFVSLLVRHGIGVSIYSGGSLVVGDEVFIGEFGHMCVDIKGPQCICGMRGCIDVFSSGRTWAPDSLGSEKAFRHELENRAFYIATGLSNLVKLNHPPLIIVNGIYNEYEDIIKPVLVDTLREHLGSLNLSPPEILFGNPVQLKTSIGAAIRAAETFFSDYIRNSLVGKIREKKTKAN